MTLGKFSYGLYLFHVPVFCYFSSPAFLFRFVHYLRSPVAVIALWRVFAICVTALLTVISYYLLEKPALSLKRRFVS